MEIVFWQQIKQNLVLAFTNRLNNEFVVKTEKEETSTGS